MVVIKDIEDFKNMTSGITSFSHAYLFKVNDLELGYKCAKEFAKKIICDNCDDTEIRSHQIDEDEYDDLYVVNPSTISINSAEITKLLNYMETKSLRPNGKRVYIIYGYERISREVSNKILKFLEEPNDNIYGILLTADVDKILPTIVSRCQMMLLSFEHKEKLEINKIEDMKKYLEELLKRKYKMIAYNNNYFLESMQNRELFLEKFEILERIISNNIKTKYNLESEDIFNSSVLQSFDINDIIIVLKITNQLKSLIKRNINLSLLLDRYIIELVRELQLC